MDIPQFDRKSEFLALAIIVHLADIVLFKIIGHIVGVNSNVGVTRLCSRRGRIIIVLGQANNFMTNQSEAKSESMPAEKTKERNSNANNGEFRAGPGSSKEKSGKISYECMAREFQACVV